MAHIISPPAEELLDKEIKCLDKGFVRLVDYLADCTILASLPR